MSQKPIDQRGILHTRAILWQVMREIHTFSAPELAKHTRYHASTISTYLQGLLAAGYLQAVQGTKPTAFTFAEQVTIPAEAPRVRKDGTAVTQGQGRKNLWRTAKMAVFASTPTVSIAEKDAACYVHYLHQAGYLVLVKASKTTGGRARYRFVMARYTGPLAPQVQRVKQVYDPNTGQVVWSGGADGR